jgi:hypothetical protein
MEAGITQDDHLFFTLSNQPLKGVICDIGEKSAKAQSSKSVSMRAWAFFSPSLHPILDGRKGHKDAVVSPEVPTRRPVGQAVLDHQSYCQIHHAVRVRTARWPQIGEVRVKVLATLGAGMLRIRDHEIPRTPQVEIPQVV